MRGEQAPLSLGKIAEHHVADAHALQAQHLQAHQLAHAAYLALLAITQHEAQLILVLPFDFRGPQHLAVQRQALFGALDVFPRPAAAARLAPAPPLSSFPFRTLAANGPGH